MSSDSSVTPTVSARARRSAPTTKVDAGSRARASRRNGAKSRGPRTAAGKARSARNALKHGLCAKKSLLLPQEDTAAFAALETALLEELAPVGALQAVLAGRVVSAAWRLLRADRMEAEALGYRSYDNASLGLALLRDGNGTGSVETVRRYRAAALSEFQRALAMLQALQARTPAEAEPPVRRRGPRPGAIRNEPKRSIQINGLTEKVRPDQRPCTDAATASNLTVRDTSGASPIALQGLIPCDAHPDLHTIIGIVASIAAGGNETNPRQPAKSMTCV